MHVGDGSWGWCGGVVVEECCEELAVLGVCRSVVSKGLERVLSFL